MHRIAWALDARILQELEH